MSEFDNKIENFKKVFTEYRKSKYKIVNTDLLTLDEYSKNLYIKLLCTLMQYNNTPNDMQVLFIERILLGLELDGGIQEHLKKAYEITEADINDFVAFMKGDKRKYYFALDGVILVSLGEHSDKNYDYLSELIESLGITNSDVSYISMVAKSIIEQASNIYDLAKEEVTENTKGIDVQPYIKNYYTGIITDTDEVVSYLGVNIDFESEENKFRNVYKSNKIMFDNASVKIEGEISFEGCDSVILKKSAFKGRDGFINFAGCKNIIIENCTFEEFDSGYGKVLKFSNCENVVIRNSRFKDIKSKTIVENNVTEFIIENTEFIDCLAIISSGWSQWYSLGGVIYTETEGEDSGITINNCVFKNCGGKNKEHCYRTAIISNMKCIVKDSKFYNCWHYSYFGIDPDNPKGVLFNNCIEQTNNEIIGSANLCE